MNTRHFGRTGHEVGEIGLGCWQLGGIDWNGLSDLVARSVLIAAADSGVNFFDTSDVYGGGRSEEVLGHFLKFRKGHFLVATKVGRAQGMYPNGYSEKNIIAAIEASLKRLGLPALPLVQLHYVPTDILKQGEIFDWLRRLKADGKIQNFGASVETVEEAQICLDQPGLASLQIIFNVFRQKPAQEIFPIALQKGVAVIARSPYASELLSGHLTGRVGVPPLGSKMSPATADAETYCGLPFDRGLELASRLQTMVPHGMTLPQLAMRYILDHQAVSVVIPGSSRPAEATSTAQAAAMPPLPPTLHDRLREFYQDEVAPHIQGPY